MGDASLVTFKTGYYFHMYDCSNINPLNDTRCRSLSDYVLNLFQSKDTSDIVIRLVDTNSNQPINEYSLHKLVLMQCDMFMNMFKQGCLFKDSLSKSVDIFLDSSIYSKECIDTFFIMLYTSNLSVIENINNYCTELHSLCDMYGFKRGERYCEERIVESIENNLLNVLQYSEYLTSKKLFYYCMQWLRTFVSINITTWEVLNTLPFCIIQELIKEPCFMDCTDLIKLRLTAIANYDDMEKIESLSPPNGFTIKTLICYSDIYCTHSDSSSMTPLVIISHFEFSGLHWKIYLVKHDTQSYKVAICANKIVHTSFTQKRQSLIIRLGCSIFLMNETITINDTIAIMTESFRSDSSIVIPVKYFERAYCEGTNFNSKNISFDSIQTQTKQLNGTPTLFLMFSIQLLQNQ